MRSFQVISTLSIMVMKTNLGKVVKQNRIRESAVCIALLRCLFRNILHKLFLIRDVDETHILLDRARL